jgi:hypothetical protein
MRLPESTGRDRPARVGNLLDNLLCRHKVLDLAQKSRVCSGNKPKQKGKGGALVTHFLGNYVVTHWSMRALNTREESRVHVNR